MQRRTIAAVVAAVLAVVGAVLLFSYVSGADKRAMAGMETTSVLVVTSAIPKGTAATALGTSVAVKTLPKEAVASDTAASVADLGNRVAAVDLEPGEQVLLSRFVDASTLTTGDELTIPAGLQQVSVMLEAQRVLGGNLNPGDLVGVFISTTVGQAQSTHLTLTKVLVTDVSGGVSAPATSSKQSTSNVAASNTNVMVTLALNAADAEKLVYGAQNGALWLSLESSKTNLAGARVVNQGNIYK